tara:strand:- start:1157 stop:1453 length:297 start_codon:yes stop_codon:yes gene_type:complete
MRLIEKLGWKSYAQRLNGVYRRILKDDDHNLIIRDIVGFAKLGEYDPTSEYTPEKLMEMRGRQQMALHILRHLDADVEAQIRANNDAQAQASAMDYDQ